MEVWQFIAQKYQAKTNVVLLYVLHSLGSSPGRQGFKMAVASDGDFCGSIGGGMMEHKFVEMAKARLAEKGMAAAVYRQIHDKSAGKNQSGMICSGEQTIFLYPMQDKDMAAINSLLSSLEKNEQGTLHLTEEGIRFSDEIPPGDFCFEPKSEQAFTLVERTGYKNTLHIIGGGHCALSLAKLMRDMDFYIHLYDERSDLNTMEANIYAHEKHVVAGYESLRQLIHSGKNIYVVIMTFGYRTDDIALKALQDKHFRYIGLLGSKYKVNKLFSGYPPEIVSTIHSPIGIPIKSQTPAEIAVSIAAEIILEKNKDQ
ncbi:XdhC family protein [Ferruginibacter sp. HRS2-29]|uniref:XdhC family protein n=1 Tax=Ferruginibacter sp. HRS2-29 TaxID=2487334 RepID=UPI0020CDBE9F|nr:XdhC/CoxI family protein [Ferruginibacter sp. HRS2-29]MCP9750737.1 XdhC/CoxI family protein [Ferruginibacter sp. HRS2-29]